MRYTFDQEQILQVAKEMGLKARFGSEKPGIKNKKTGEVTDFVKIMELFVDTEVNHPEYDKFAYQGTINLKKDSEKGNRNKEFNISRVETKRFKYEEVVQGATIRKKSAIRFENITLSNFQFTEEDSVA